MTRLSVKDTIALPTQRTITADGFMLTTARASRTGTQDYRAFELGLTDRDPMAIVVAYRPPEEVFAPDSLASFQHKSIVDDHKPVNADNWKEVSVGDAHNMRKGEYVDAEGHYTDVDLVVKDSSAVAKINAGKVQLSCGYDFEPDWTPGTAPNGKKYDFVQRKIRGNHIALVDAARCGPACRVGDSTKEPRTMTDRTIVVDGIPVLVNDASAAVIDKLQKQLTEMGVTVAARDAQLKEVIVIGDKSIALSDSATLKTAIATLVNDLATAKKDVMTPEQRDAMVADWAETIEDGKRLFAGLDHKGKTCHAIRVEVLKHVANDEALKQPLAVMCGGKAVDQLDQEQARTAFKLVASLKPAADAATEQNRMNDGAAFLNKQDPAQNGNGGTQAVVDAHMDYTARMANAWQTKKGA